MEMMRADIFVMFLILGRKFLVFQLLLCMYVIWGFFIDVLYQIEEILSPPGLLSISIMKAVGFCQVFFSASIEITTWILSFIDL